LESKENASQNDDIDLKELFGVLWAGKLLIVAITSAFTIVSIFFALSIPNQYKATTLLAPAQSTGGGLSATLSQLGGLASLAGVSLDGGESSESEVAQKIMKSWSFMEAFIADNDIAVEIYAGEGWDRALNEVEINSQRYNASTNEWLLLNKNSGELGPPTSWQLFKRFSRMLSVSQDKKSGLITVSIEYYSPDIAKEWVDLYVTAINKHMQTRQVRRVATNISYLESQIDKTSIARMREVFYTLIEEQTKEKMVAEASPDYTFITVSPSMVPEEKSTPRRAMICIFGFMFGGGLGVLVVFFRYYFNASFRLASNKI